MPNQNDPNKPKPSPGTGGTAPGTVKKPGQPPKKNVPTPDGDDKPPQKQY